MSKCLWSTAALLLIGCVGSIEDRPGSKGPTSPSRSGIDDTGVEPGSGLCEGFDVGPSGLARLTAVEYRNTVRDLFGEAVEPPDTGALPPDERAGAFDSNLLASISEHGVEIYRDVAETLAPRVAANLDGLLPCAPSGPEDRACAEQLIRELGSRAYRRPLSDEEVAGIGDVYQVGVDTGGTFESGMELALLALLQSPHFLYRVERGVPGTEAGEIVQLGPYEIASRLSYFLWKTMPDEALFAAAESGELSTPEGIVAQAERMLEDPRGERAIRTFFRDWLNLAQLDGLERSDSEFPEFVPELGPQMRRETEAFVSYVMNEGDRRFDTLMTASFTFAEPELADLVYGVAPGDGTDPARIELDPTQRAGLLTHPGVLAAHSHVDQTSPVHRGKLVRERMFCQALPPPPPTVDDTAPPVDPSLPTKERFSAHSENEACVGCHQLMDPIGFGLENYDAMGRWRDMEGMHPVDSAGEIVAADVAGYFDGGVELAGRLSESRQVQTCFADQWMTFVLGRTRTEQDLCSFDGAMKVFLETGGDIRELILALITSDAFRFRRIPQE